MQQNHQLDISVSADGGLDVKVHYRGQVPDLLSRFSEEVRTRAMRFVWWKTRYERRLLRACRGMPEWAKATIRQHILHERAVRIEAEMKRQAEKRRLKEQRKTARMEAVRQVAAQDTDNRKTAAAEQKAKSPSGTVEGTGRADALGLQENASREREPTVEWASPSREIPLSLTEQFARSTGALTAVPRPKLDRGRGR